MHKTHFHTRGRLLHLAVLFALLLGSLGSAVQPAQAAPTELFFSEYIEGTSNNKALEIYNGTGAAVDLGAGGYNVQMFFNGNPVSTLTINLIGTVANWDVFVLAHSSANATILAQADQTNGSGWFNGDDAVVLRKGTTILDVIGQIGFDPGTEWGTGLTSTADNTLRRKEPIEAGDPDGSNPFDPAIQWDGYATDTFDGLGTHGEVAPVVASTYPMNGATDTHFSSDMIITFNEPVYVADSWFTLSCSASGNHTASVSGGPSSFTLNPDIDFQIGESCTLVIHADKVADQDSNDPPDTMTADYITSFTTVDACQLSYTPIPTIQGSGLAVAIPGMVSTRGIVVGDFEGTASAQGFYLQDANGDGNVATSDGIFVFTGSADTVSAGEEVRVTGYARERFNQTTLNGSNDNSSAVAAVYIVSCGTGSVTGTDVVMPFDSLTYPERYEGMLVRLPQPLVISEYFNYDRFGEIVLGLPLDGETRPFTPTAIDEPGAPARARALANSLRRITLDDAQSAQNPETLRHPNGSPFSLTNLFRGGDFVQNTVGVLGFDFSLYRIFPTGPADYTAVNPRPAEPEPVGGSLRVAAMNTLNYFLSPDNIQEASNAPDDTADNICGPIPSLECRGWDGDQTEELSRQRTKLLAAINGINADILGLNEIENTIGVEPLADIVAGLNGYAYIDTGVIGTDAIRVGLIYKTATVTPVGNFKILTSTVDPRFRDTKNRPALAQTFEEISTGARFTVVVNHLKSKGSDCNDVGDRDTGDGQGNCKVTRTLAAQALVDWIATDPTGSGDIDYLILGDLNSYAMEDPIDAIKAGADDELGTTDDYTNLIAQYQGTYAYSYVFDGQAGYLDHSMASANLVSQVAGATEWHINADESDVVDYDTSFKPPAQESLYEPNAYRTSDHDPVITGLNAWAYSFSGFSPPIYNAPTLNQANAGSNIPVLFSLGGDQGLDIFAAAGYPVSQQYNCSTGALMDSPETAQTANKTGLQYDPLTGEYTFAWKTAKNWAETCRKFTMILKDGSIHTANFQFVK